MIFGRRDDTSAMEADLRAQGASDEQIAALLGDAAPVLHLDLPAALRPAIRLARALIGQWRMIGGGLAAARPVAFDLASLDVAARWLGITPSAHLLRQIQVIEGAALRAMEGKDD